MAMFMFPIIDLHGTGEGDGGGGGRYLHPEILDIPYFLFLFPVINGQLMLARKTGLVLIGQEIS